MTFDNLDHALTGAKSTVKNLNDITLKCLYARNARSFVETIYTGVL